MTIGEDEKFAKAGLTRDVSAAEAVACLEKLLAEQLRQIRQDDDARSSRTTAEAAYVAEFVAEQRVLEDPQFEQDRTKIRRLYDDISVALLSQKDKTRSRLSKVAKGHKAVSIYKQNSSSY